MMKRLFDILFSLGGLIALSPILFIVSVIIKMTSPGPVFFCQTRVGIKGIPFSIYKFRTMIPKAEQHGLKITVGCDPRITRIGAFLRKTKLDEFPQLLNVFMGDMSIVGPRPEVQEFIDEYPKDVSEKILSVRPGITDLASIELSDEASLLEGKADPRQVYIDEIMPIKAKYYLSYVANNSLNNDLFIIWATIKKVIKQALV